jgi:hypothetical protein
MPEIIVTVKPDGTSQVKAEGIQGTSCSLHTAPFWKAIGTKEGEIPTQEMYQDTTNTAQEETHQ